MRLSIKTAKIVATALFSSLLMFSPVLAETAKMVIRQPAPTQVGKIITECSNIKAHLGRLRSQDALMRVNLGQNYETMASRVMANFNLRAVSNRLNAADLVAKAAEFDENFTYFRENYTIYEKELVKLVNTDCAKSPTSFYEQLEKVRYYRSELNFNTSMLSKIADEYYQALEEFEKEFS